MQVLGVLSYDEIYVVSFRFGFSRDGQETSSLPADVLWGSFVTHSVGEKWMRDKRTPKDVCGEARKLWEDLQLSFGNNME